MIRFVLLLSVISLLAGCSKETADYKKYFSPTAQDGRTRYQVFSEQTITNGEKYYTQALRRSEKLNDSTLLFVEFTCYEDTCFAADSTIMVMREDGVYMKESYVGSAKGWTALSNLSTSVSVPWEWEKDREVTYRWDIKQADAPMFSIRSKRKFTGFEKVSVEGKGKMNAAVRQEEQTRMRGNRKEKVEVTMWDVPNFGLYRYESKSKDREYLMVFRKELNQKEYNEMLGR
ncbi:MAG: hypothetical protein Crog4KO_31380 [Crocinitomicaceae bacterium]